MQRFQVTRGVIGQVKPVRFDIEAVNGADAAHAADEIQYAIAYRLGHYPDDQHKAIPPQWAAQAAAAVIRDERLNKYGRR